MLDSLKSLFLVVIFIMIIITAGAGVYWTPNPTTPRSEWLKRSVASGLMAGMFVFLSASAVILATTPTSDIGLLWRVFPVILILTLIMGLLFVIGMYARVITWHYYERVTEWGLSKLSKMTKKRK